MFPWQGERSRDEKHWRGLRGPLRGGDGSCPATRAGWQARAGGRSLTVGLVCPVLTTRGVATDCPPCTTPGTQQALMRIPGFDPRNKDM